MRSLFLTLLLALAGCGAPTTLYSLEADGLRVVLFDAPCAAPPVLARVSKELHSRLKAGEATISGEPKPRALCWGAEGGLIAFMDDKGDSGIVPESVFKKAGK